MRDEDVESLFDFGQMSMPKKVVLTTLVLGLLDYLICYVWFVEISPPGPGEAMALLLYVPLYFSTNFVNDS